MVVFYTPITPIPFILSLSLSLSYTHTHTLARSLAHGVNICNIIHGFERGYGNQSSLRTCVNLFMYVYKDILYDYLDTKHNFKSYGILRDRRLSKTVMYLSIIDFIEVLKPM